MAAVSQVILTVAALSKEGISINMGGKERLGERKGGTGGKDFEIGRKETDVGGEEGDTGSKRMRQEG